MHSLFDAAWRQRALDGDATAIKALTDEILPPLYRFCLYRVGRNRHLCEEVVQETLLRALRTLSRYDPARATGNIFPWLTGLARNEITRAQLRDERVLRLHPDDLATHAGAMELAHRELGIGGHIFDQQDAKAVPVGNAGGFCRSRKGATRTAPKRNGRHHG